MQLYQKTDSGTGSVMVILQKFSEHRFAKFLWTAGSDLQLL